MKELGARSVFFVRDTSRAVGFYTTTLGFSLDWTHEEEGRAFVVQVSLLGLQIILNQVELNTAERPGAGRIFLGIDEEQSTALLEHVLGRGISVGYAHWGAPTIVMNDLDRNELFFWVPESEHAKWREANWTPP